MTKSELIEILSARHSQLAPKDAELAVKTMLDAMAQTLAQGDRIEIRGFGSFGLNDRPPRMGRNPKTGEKVLVPRKRVPHFKAGKELRERVDLIDAQNAAAAAEAAKAPGITPAKDVPATHTGSE
ncbi:MAG: integration host factor subunit beta [Betaproteobacteria bacterium]|nr:integration host factor subunit beta [Betaproteobacteria bacterium]